MQCLWKDTDGSTITPSILGLRSSGSCSSRGLSGCVWNWCVAGVKSVTVDFGVEILVLVLGLLDCVMSLDS